MSGNNSGSRINDTNAVSIVVSDSYTGENQPSVANDPIHDHFLVVWHGPLINNETGLQSSNNDIFGQLVNVDGSRMGTRIHISSNSTNGKDSNSEGAANVAFSNVSQQFLVAWQDGQAISGQLLDSNGSVIGSKITIVQSNHTNVFPIVAADSHGNFMVTWYGDENAGESGIYDIYGRIIDSRTSNTVSDIITIAGNNTNVEINPSIVFDNASDNYFVVWERGASNSGNGTNSQGPGIVGQFIDPSGKTVGKSILVSNGGTEPAVAANPTKSELLVVWQANGGNGSSAGTDSSPNIYGRLISSKNQTSSLLTAGNSNAIAISEAPDFQGSPDVSYNRPSDRYLVVWQDDRNMINVDKNSTGIASSADTYGQLIDSAGNLVGKNTKISRSLGDELFQSVAASSSTDRFLAVWEDRTNLSTTGFDIMGRITPSANGLEFADENRIDAYLQNDPAWKDDAKLYLRPLNSYENCTTANNNSTISSGKQALPQCYPISTTAIDKMPEVMRAFVTIGHQLVQYEHYVQQQKEQAVQQPNSTSVPATTYSPPEYYTIISKTEANSLLKLVPFDPYGGPLYHTFVEYNNSKYLVGLAIFSELEPQLNGYIDMGHLTLTQSGSNILFLPKGQSVTIPVKVSTPTYSGIEFGSNGGNVPLSLTYSSDYQNYQQNYGSLEQQGRILPSPLLPSGISAHFNPRTLQFPIAPLTIVNMTITAQENASDGKYRVYIVNDDSKPPFFFHTLFDFDLIVGNGSPYYTYPPNEKVDMSMGHNVSRIDFKIITKEVNCSDPNQLIEGVIFSNKTFDATKIANESLYMGQAAEYYSGFYGPTWQNATNYDRHVDYNKDGFVDRIVYFKFGDTYLHCWNDKADIIGYIETGQLGGFRIYGIDTIKMSSEQ